MSELKHHTFTDLTRDGADKLLTFAGEIDVAAVLHAADPGHDRELRNVGVAYQDDRSLARLLLFIENGYVEHKDPMDPEIAKLVHGYPGGSSEPNLDRESAAYAGILVRSAQAAERAAVEASRAGDELRDLAGRRPTMTTYSDDGERTSWAPPPSMARTWAGWSEWLFDLAAVADLVELEAGRRAAAADSAIADLPEHLRPARVPAHLIAQLEVERVTVACPECRHAAHEGPCMNMASDGDCSCPGSLAARIAAVTADVEALDPTVLDSARKIPAELTPDQVPIYLGDKPCPCPGHGAQVCMGHGCPCTIHLGIEHPAPALSPED